MSLSLVLGPMTIIDILVPLVALMINIGIYTAPVSFINAQRRLVNKGLGVLNPYNPILSISGGQLWLVYASILKDPWICINQMISLPISFYYISTCFALMNLHYGQVLLAAPVADGIQKDAIDIDMKQYRRVQFAFVTMIFVWSTIYATAFTFYGLSDDKLEEFVGLLCGIHGYIYNLKYTPQLYIIWRRKDVSSIMPMLMIMDFLSSVAWAAYGLQLGNVNILYPNIVGIGYGIAYIFFYILYRKNLPVLDNADAASIPMIVQDKKDDNLWNGTNTQYTQPATTDPTDGFTPLAAPSSTSTGDSTDKDNDDKDDDPRSSLHSTADKDASSPSPFDPLGWVDDAMISLVNIGRSRANTMLIDVQQEQDVALLDASIIDTVDLVADTIAQDPIGISSDLCPYCSQYLVYNSSYCWSCGNGVGGVVRERRTARSDSGTYSWDNRSRATSDARSRTGSASSYSTSVGHSSPVPVPNSSVEFLTNMGSLPMKINGDTARQELERISEVQESLIEGLYEDNDNDNDNDKNV